MGSTRITMHAPGLGATVHVTAPPAMLEAFLWMLWATILSLTKECVRTEVFEEISQNRGFTRERWSVVNRRFHRRHDHILIAGQHELEPPGTLTAEHARLLYFCNIGSSACCVLVALCAWGD